MCVHACTCVLGETGIPSVHRFDLGAVIAVLHLGGKTYACPLTMLREGSLDGLLQC